MYKILSKTIWILSLISLFTDMASEMLYPIMPIYLKSIGFSVLLIGVLEGIAEATAGISKGYFGKRSDNSGKRVPFVQLGYALSAISKPMMAIYVYPLWIFLARTVDRFGKGIRTGAHDALLSDEATPETKGRVFGFHRSMDTLGAVLGPLLALAYLYFYPNDYKTLFFIAFVPGLLAIFASFFLKDKPKASLKPKVSVSFFTLFSYWKTSSINYRKLLIGLLAFTFVNSSDVFLLLKVKEAGLDDTAVVGIYIFYNLVYALFAFPIGIIADKIGLKTIFISGILVFSLVNFGMSLATGTIGFLVIFFLYGLYAAATEGISKAWISIISPKDETATAIGTYAGFQSLATLYASALTGFIWYKFGSNIAFLITAVGSLLSAVYLMSLENPSK
ncbi:MAG: MFS transporter [Bacteroidetes bacterium]|nr:MFS transporter [Bacteroidota bacterium]